MHTCLAETIGLYDARALVFLSFIYKNIYAYQISETCICYITTASITLEQHFIAPYILSLMKKFAT